jgi:hypothetical protein
MNLENENTTEKETFRLQEFAYQKRKLSVKRLTGIFIIVDICLLVFVVLELIKYIQNF